MLTRVAGSARSGRKLLHWRARRVLAYVETHLNERITLDALARQACLSVSQFSRCFKVTFGVTVHLYLMQRRVQVAQAMMLGTSEPLSEIAVCCGLNDQSHLTRWFRRVVGATPGAWRRARYAPQEVRTI